MKFLKRQNVSRYKLTDGTIEYDTKKVSINPADDGNINLKSDTLIKGNLLVDGNIISDNLQTDTISITNYDETTWYVSEDSGSDTNDGRLVYSAFKTIKYTLTQVAEGDTVIILPGEYQEEFPLVVPKGVTVKGSGLRATAIKPTTATKDKDCFLLNGESTVEDLTIKGMFYNSTDDTGYAFRFASSTVVAERSPYVQRVTVLNRGSVVSSSDPYGFSSADAGRGALLDGSRVSRNSVEAAMLFNECTFIVPNSRALIMTNGARTEWLNCFTYFADLAIEGRVGAQGRGGDGKTRLTFSGVSGAGFQVGEIIRISSTDDSTVIDVTVDSVVGDTILIDGKIDSLQGTDFTPKSIIGLTSNTTASSITRYDRSEFAAEMRAISGANVYGNQAVKADGADVVLQLMAWNFAYIGTGADLTNDKSSVSQLNEVIEINGGRVYYNSVDQAGNFRVGDLFSVNFETGAVNFTVPTFDISSLTGISFTDGVNTTVVNPVGVQTGRFNISGNTISTTAGAITIDPSGNENINLNGDTNISGNLGVTGNVTIGGNIQIGDQDVDSVTVVADFTSNLLPNSSNTYDLGSTTKIWRNVYAKTASLETVNISGNLDVTGNTTISGNLGVTGNVTIGGNIQIGDQDVDSITVVADFTSNLTPDISDTYDLGSTTKIWRNVYAKTANLETVNISENLTVFNNVSIAGNTTIGNENSDGVTFTAEATSNLVPKVTDVHSLGSSSKKWKNVFTTTLDVGNIDVTGNLVKTVTANSDLELSSNGTGKILLKSNSEIQGNLYVKGNVSITTDYLGITGTTISSTVSNSNIKLDPSGTGLIDVSSTRIINLETPVNSNDAANKSYVDQMIGTTQTKNVMYVSIDGNDNNDGRSKARPKRTIKSALADLTIDSALNPNVTVFVSTGDYVEDNPLEVPAGVSIIGDNLRAVTVRPLNKTQDLFHVYNAVYLAHMTFKDHEAPAAAVAFNPQGSGVIFTSPYVQNCTSMTTTGTGMRIDGDHAEGLRSMVVDAYTQFNQGGIGIHMLNRGNAQLVSVFTICCDKSILCESGGFCSITNSNTSFGNYGLWSQGVSSTLYSGKLVGNYDSASREIVMNNLTTKPNIGDAVSFTDQADNSTVFSTVRSATPFKVGNVDVEDPEFSFEPNDKKNIRQAILDQRNKIKTDTINFLQKTYPWFVFDTFKCTRDVGLMIEAAVDDMMFGTNYKTVQAGLSYYRQNAAKVVNDQKTETVAAIVFVKESVLKVIENDSVQSVEYVLIENNFNILIDILTNGAGSAPSYTFPDPTNVIENRSKASKRIRDNREFFVEEGIEYITQNFPSLSYNQTQCRKDIRFIVDAISYDILYKGNSQTADAADEYYHQGQLQISLEEKPATIATFNFLKDRCADIIAGNVFNPLNIIVSPMLDSPAATTDESDISNALFDIVIELINNGYSSTVTLERTIGFSAPTGRTVTFHQYSLVTTSGHTFEWVGAGTNVNTSLPYLGGINIQENEIIELNGGKVYFTSTDQKGDFRIGSDLVINRDSGTISGRTFTKSLFALMTPYTLAIGD